MAQIGSQLSIFPKIYFFGKVVCYYCLPTVFYHTTFLKKIIRENHQTRLHSFGPNWVQVALSTKRDFFGTIDQHCFGLLYPIMLHNFKKILRQQIMRIRFAYFLPKLSLAPKEYFLGKLTNITDV